MTTGDFIRERLIEAGDKGVCPADLHRERKANWEELGLKKVTGIHHSFQVFFAVLIRLKWVEKTGEEEVAHRKGSFNELNPSIPRKFYRITPEGLAQEESAWKNPVRVLYPREKKSISVVTLDRGSQRFSSQPE